VTSSPSDNERRLRLRVTLKLMAAAGVVAAAMVLVGYLAGSPDATPAPPVRRVAVDGLAPGQARTVLWDGRPVIVLHRGAGMHADAGGADPAWFVALAADPGTGCPVQWRPGPGEFHSPCGPARFDAAGRPLDGSASRPLETPPHRLTADGVLVLGGG
jgi:ubiquinol-cytochrome c reductase iron-sulfur subunit